MHEVAETSFATIMLRSLNSVKRGSAKEMCLATKALGLLAMNVGPGDNAHQLYEESLATYSQVLNFEDESVKLLESLAIVTLVGAKDSWETERSMKFMWQLIHQSSDSCIFSKKKSRPVLAAAVSAWSFLLATIDGQRVNNKYWQGALSYFMNLLDEEESLRAVCVEALALIFEKGCVEKFSHEVYKTFAHGVIEEEDTTSCIQEWKDKVIEQFNKTSDPNWEVVKYFKDGCKLTTCMNVDGNILSFSTLSQLIKFKFLEQFLGGGFDVHMMENELFHQAFDFTPKAYHPSGPELYVPETKKVMVCYFLPNIKKDDSKQR